MTAGLSQPFRCRFLFATVTTTMMMMITCGLSLLLLVCSTTTHAFTSNTHIIATRLYPYYDSSSSSSSSSQLYAQLENERKQPPQSPRPSFPLLPNLFQRRSNDNESDNMVRLPPEQFTSSYLYDGTTNDGLILHAKYFIQQTDCGLSDPTILLSDDDDSDNNSNKNKNDRNTDDTNYNRFQYINAQLEIPLSKTDYITAGRYFNLRNAFPDFNYRPYDFRIVEENTGSAVNYNNQNQNIVTIRCTCRCTGTMRGELRLRNNVILAPTGITMRAPPEAVTITMQRDTGKVVQLCTGFVMDRCIGNTQGTTGVQAASIIAGEDISKWDIYPPMTILQNILARPIPPTRESPATVSPFPESVMMQLAKGIVSSQMAYNDPTLLSDTTFTYSTPIVGPITKSDFVKSYALQEFPSPIQPIWTNFRIDPYDPVRVWVDVVLTVPAENFMSPPQAMSFSFDENGYCTRITSQAVMDPSQSNTAGGLGGYEGYQYYIGQASPGIFTRPISRSLERLRLRLISPLTGINVDEYQLPKPRRNLLEMFTAATTTTTTTPTTIKPKVTKPQPPSKPPPSAVVVENNEVVKRLESLKEFTSSIRIIPPSLSDKDSSKTTRPTTSTTGTAQERLARATKAAEQSKLMIEKAKREAAALQQKIALAEANAVKQKKQQQEQAAIKAKQLEATKAVEKQKQQQATAIQQQQQKKAAEAARQKQQAAAAAQKVADAARQKEQLALEKRRKEEDIERQKRAAAAAAAEAEIRQREFEAQRIAEAAAREAKKVQMMKEQLAATEARTRRESSSSSSSSSNTAIKANVAAARIATGTTTPTKKSPSVPIQRAATPSRSVYSMKGTDTDASPALEGLARATISLFGLGKSELEELPAPKVKSPVTSSAKGGSSTVTGRRAPIGVPTVTRWRQNPDQTITGLVKGSRNFDDGSRITTSPITSGTIASGEVVKTGSGSRYFLE